MTNIELECYGLFKTMAHRIVEKLTTPDWEKRRYETARDLFVHCNMSARNAVETADELMEALKCK